MDNLFRHIFIEFYYRNGKFLNEHNSKLTFRKLNESYGVFDGCYDLAKQIYNHLKELASQTGEYKSRNEFEKWRKSSFKLGHKKQ